MKEFYAGEQAGSLGSIVQAVTSALMYAVHYDEWLRKGEVLTGVVVTTDGGAATINNITYNPQEKTAYFFLNGGNAGDTFNILISATTSLGQNRNDYIAAQIVNITGGT